MKATAVENIIEEAVKLYGVVGTIIVRMANNDRFSINMDEGTYNVDTDEE